MLQIDCCVFVLRQKRKMSKIFRSNVHSNVHLTAHSTGRSTDRLKFKSFRLFWITGKSSFGKVHFCSSENYRIARKSLPKKWHLSHSNYSNNSNHLNYSSHFNYLNHSNHLRQLQNISNHRNYRELIRATESGQRGKRPRFALDLLESTLDLPRLSRICLNLLWACLVSWICFDLLESVLDLLRVSCSCFDFPRICLGFVQIFLDLECSLLNINQLLYESN